MVISASPELLWSFLLQLHKFIIYSITASTYKSSWTLWEAQSGAQSSLVMKLRSLYLMYLSTSAAWGPESVPTPFLEGQPDQGQLCSVESWNPE